MLDILKSGRNRGTILVSKTPLKILFFLTFSRISKLCLLLLLLRLCLLRSHMETLPILCNLRSLVDILTCNIRSLVDILPRLLLALLFTEILQILLSRLLMLLLHIKVMQAVFKLIIYVLCILQMQIWNTICVDQLEIEDHHVHILLAR
ncbi:hypothetical protein LguiB_013372 [Lonicera macranthoides]